MKAGKIIALIGGGLLLASLVVYFFFFRTKKSDEIENKLPETPPAAPPPIAPAAGTPSRLYSTTSGEGATAIKARIKEMYKTQEGRDAREAIDARGRMFAGLQYPAGIQAILASATPDGNPFSYPIEPPTVSGNFQSRMQAILNTTGFEKVTAQQGGNVDTAKAFWKAVLALPEYGTLWPANLEEILRAGVFGTPGKADKNLSERYDAMTKDAQKLAANLIAISNSLDAELNARAIASLRNSGWRFEGLDQPN